MSMLSRYKKSGGIIELAKLIEESGEPKRSQLLSMIRQEDPEFAVRVEGRLFTYEMLKTLPENLLAEIVTSTPPKILAVSLTSETSEEFLKLCERCLGPNFGDYRSEKELLQEASVTPAQIEAARKKMIAVGRKLESEGRIKLPFTEAPSSAAAPVRVAEAAPQTAGAGSPSTAPSVQGMTANPADETELSGCPPIESFGMEPPPPGLSGERLESFFKQNLS